MIQSMRKRLHSQIVNVSSIPLRSPFRYPGGKTWLVPRIRLWLASMAKRPAEFIEAFSGGAIVGLTVAAENLANKVTLVEKDEQVAAVWNAIITDGEGLWLANRIAKFELTSVSLQYELGRRVRSTRAIAFQTVLKNRTFHGGMLAAGSAPLKNGENGRGILSRWYPETLKSRILQIDKLRDRISFVKGDGLEVIKNNCSRIDAAFFLDPPYSVGGKKAGQRLYTCSEIDHEALFEHAASLKGEFLMTYDNVPAVRRLARKHGFDFEVVKMKNRNQATMSELLVGRNLSWLDN